MLIPEYIPEDTKEVNWRQAPTNYLAHGLIGKQTKSNLSKKEIDSICNYLENPTKVGIWTLKGKWNKFGGISKSVIEKLEEEFKKETIELQEGKRRIKLKPEKELLDSLKQNTRKFTFLFELFTFLVYVEKQGGSFVNYSDYLDYLIFNIINLDEIKKAYADAFNYFKENIYFEGFNPTVRSNELIKIKDGIFILTKSFSKDSEYAHMPETGRTPEDYITLVSIDIESLEKINLFYEKLEKISDVSIIPIFSPEEEVFEPYFSFLQETYLYFIDNESIKSHFRNSISEYNDNNYPHCISTVGLILEDYLIQVYETFFRDVCPKGLTIGELFNLIQTKVGNRFKPSAESNPEIKPLYNSISSLDQTVEQANFNKGAIKVLRELLNYLIKDKKHIISLITANQNKENMPSIFPSQLIDNIKEAIKNRNAISHKSTVPIGKYEALRTVYCCMTLIIWWNTEKKKITWNASAEEILKQTVERNSRVSLN